MSKQAAKEDGLLRPQRSPLGQNTRGFWNEELLQTEMRRVFAACHSCRRCVSLCHSFPTLFDLIDNNPDMDVSGLSDSDCWQVVDHCYLCDLCFVSKCPYVPPHEWNIDFPHLMLRAKAVRYRKQGSRWRDRLLSSPEKTGALLSRPWLAPLANRLGRSPVFRRLLHHTLDLHHEATLPVYQRRPLSRRLRPLLGRGTATQASPAGNHRPDSDRVAIFTTCYGNYNEPQIGEDLVRILEHNGLQVRLIKDVRCCAMPSLELGDLDRVEQARQHNIRIMSELVAQGWDIVSLIPSCTLMFKQELPLMHPEDGDVLAVKLAIYDPFEYLMRRHRAGKLNTRFKQGLGRISYHLACHQRAQRIGPQTRKLLELIPDTEVQTIERCSGHDGSYTYKREHHINAMSICKPVARKVTQQQSHYYTSDCVLAGRHIESALQPDTAADPQTTPRLLHPISLLRLAYGI